MNRAALDRRARLVIGRELLVAQSKLSDASEFARLGADAADLADVRGALEIEFGVRIADREFAFCQTVGTAIDLVETKLENRSAK